MFCNMCSESMSWDQQVNCIFWFRNTPGSKESESIQGIVDGFIAASDDINQKHLLTPILCERFKNLSEDKIKYYSSAKFGFIFAFFSSLLNFFKHGEFLNSGEMGLKSYHHFVLNSQEVHETSARVEMFKTFTDTWKNKVTSQEKADLDFFWKNLMSKAVVKEWKVQGPGQYLVVLEREIYGRSQLIGTTVMSTKTVIKLYEDEDGWKNMEFPDYQVYQVILGVSAYVKKVRLKGDEVKVTIEKCGLTYTDHVYMDEIKQIVNSFKWEWRG